MYKNTTEYFNILIHKNTTEHFSILMPKNTIEHFNIGAYNIKVQVIIIKQLRIIKIVH